MKKKLLSALLIFALLLPATLTFASAAFSDIASGMWAEGPINYMTSKKVINGYPDGSFGPDNDVTRAEFVKMLDETFGLTETETISFSDAINTAWYYLYFQRASKQGYLLSYSGNKLDPDGKLTREEAAALLVRYLALPSGEKNATTSFSDYNSISPSYRDYVLQAAYAGIINGYPDGTFGPKRTLTRAEALTVLARAAGTIYDASATGVDQGAINDKGNAVVIKSGVTVKNATFNGNVIISEGITSGSVTLENCTVKGKLFLRGNCSLTVKGGTVNVCSVTSSSSAGKVILTDKAKISSVILEKAVTVSTETGTEIVSLTVNAANSKLTGSGKLTKAAINAAGFVSDVVPTESPVIADKLTARFGGKEYPLAYDDGFSVDPTLSVIGGNEYIVGTASSAGTLYVYYTDSSVLPSDSTFETYYNSALVKKTISVTAGGNINSILYSTETISIYRYIVVMIKTSAGKNLTPVLITRSTATASGFTVPPTVVSTTTYDKMSGTPDMTGTLYYYYTDSSVTVSSASFATLFNDTASARRGAFSVSKGVPINADLKTSSTVVSYRYIVLAIWNDTDKQYTTPVVVTRNGVESTEKAFSILPAWTAKNGTDYLSGVPSVSGYLHYYYTNVSTAPTSANFNSSYTAVPSTLRGYIEITSGESFMKALKATTVGSPYIYLCVAYSSDGINYYDPMVLSRSDSTSASTGFAVAPSTAMVSGTDKLSFTPSVSGTVRYFYTYSGSPIDSASFEVQYSGLPSTLKGTITATANVAASSVSLKTNVNVDSCPNIVVMLTGSSGIAYAPVVLSRSNVSTYTGFKTLPSVVRSEMADLLSATSSVAAVMYYYYTASSTLPSANEFSARWESAPYKGTITVGKDESLSGFGLEATSRVTSYSYVVFMLKDETNNLLYKPVIVARGATAVTGNGFKVAPVYSTSGNYDAISYTPSSLGIIRYFYTNESTLSSNFMGIHNAAALKGTIQVTSLSAVTSALKQISQGSTYSNIALMLTDPNGVNYEPMIVGKQVVSGTGFSDGPILTSVGSLDVVSFTSQVAGTVYCYFSNTSGKPANAAAFDAAYAAAAVKGTVSVTTGVLSSISFQSASTSGYPYVVLMVRSSSNAAFTPVQMNHSVVNAGTGFTAGPAIDDSDGVKVKLNFTAAVGGTVLVYFTNSDTVPTAEAAQANYATAIDKLSYTTAATDQSIVIDTAAEGKYSSYKYAVVMMTQGVNNLYNPVLLTLPVWTEFLP